MNEPTPNSAASTGGDEMRQRLREIVRQQPRQMTLQLARELGVPEVEIIRAFPAERVQELEIARWEDLLRGLERVGPVRVLVSNGAATIEVLGQFGGFSTMGDYFNVQTKSLDLHIRWRELGAAFAVEKPGHLDGQSTYSFQFFDRVGDTALKIFLNFGEPLQSERRDLFCDLRERYLLANSSLKH